MDLAHSAGRTNHRVSMYGLENVRLSGPFRLSTLVIAPLRQISILSLVVRRDLICCCTSLPQGWSDKNAQKGVIRCNYCAKVSRAPRGAVRTVEPFPSFRGTNLENKNSPIGMRHSYTSTRRFLQDDWSGCDSFLTPRSAIARAHTEALSEYIANHVKSYRFWGK